jgi:hypothetical protein
LKRAHTTRGPRSPRHHPSHQTTLHVPECGPGTWTGSFATPQSASLGGGRRGRGQDDRVSEGTEGIDGAQPGQRPSHRPTHRGAATPKSRMQQATGSAGPMQRRGSCRRGRPPRAQPAWGEGSVGKAVEEATATHQTCARPGRRMVHPRSVTTTNTTQAEARGEGAPRRRHALGEPARASPTAPSFQPTILLVSAPFLDETLAAAAPPRLCALCRKPAASNDPVEARPGFFDEVKGDLLLAVDKIDSREFLARCKARVRFTPDTIMEYRQAGARDPTLPTHQVLPPPHPTPHTHL